ncbi:PLDc N-terminal domain-containing protein [Halomonas salifodinae]|uniref:PLDc N-terminal domain-containing protein n=1 Tax=Halomonas salifodinae TaxID=438745 RepID=A0ABW2ETG7_9GAMM
MGIEVAGLFGLIWLIIVIWAIVKVAKSGAGPVVKLLWILILLFFPLIWPDRLAAIGAQGVAPARRCQRRADPRVRPRRFEPQA